MREKYFLNTDTLPTVPVPHDCVIDEMSFDEEYLVFKFEDDISKRDSIKYIRPNARSLIIRLHLISPDFDIYRCKSSNIFGKGSSRLIQVKNLQKLRNRHFEYLYHNIGYNSIMIKLFREGFYLCDIDADFIEFEWIEK